MQKETRKAICMRTSIMDRALVSARRAAHRMPLSRGMDPTLGDRYICSLFSAADRCVGKNDIQIILNIYSRITDQSASSLALLCAE